MANKSMKKLRKRMGGAHAAAAAHKAKPMSLGHALMQRRHKRMM